MAKEKGWPDSGDPSTVPMKRQHLGQIKREGRRRSGKRRVAVARHNAKTSPGRSIVCLGYQSRFLSNLLVTAGLVPGGRSYPGALSFEGKAG